MDVRTFFGATKPTETKTIETKPKRRFRYEDAPDLSERRAEWVKRNEAFWERMRTWVGDGTKKNAEREALDVEFKTLEKEARTLWTASDVRKKASERPM